MVLRGRPELTVQVLRKYSCSSSLGSKERSKFDTRMKEKKKSGKNRQARRDLFFFKGMNYSSSLLVLARNLSPFFMILVSEVQG